MKDIAELMSHYVGYHRKKITIVTHFIGIPLIFIAIQMFISYVDFVHLPISLSYILLIILLGYYLLLDVFLALVSALFLLPFTYLAIMLAGLKHSQSISIFILLFVLGWVLQLIGHYFEGNRPALLDNISAIFIAPIFLAAELCFMVGLKKNLQKRLINLSQG